jgi:transposase
MVEDLRSLLREFAGRNAKPTAMILDSRTLQSTPESGARAGYDGAKRRKDSKVHAAVDTLGHLLALHVTAADEKDRAQVERLAAQVQQITGDHLELAYVDQGYTGQAAEEAAASHGNPVGGYQTYRGKRGFVLLPRRWVVERSFPRKITVPSTSWLLHAHKIEDLNGKLTNSPPRSRLYYYLSSSPGL